jgi:hypothetical protein
MMISEDLTLTEIEHAIGEWAINYVPGPKYPNRSTPEEMGKALKAIRDQRLFREQASNFYVYCARRWGMKPHVVDGYIARYEGYIAPPIPVKKLVDEKKASVVYFLKGGELIKIGFTVDLDKRINAIQNMSPVQLRLLATMSGDKNTEQDIHKRFSHLRVHGEWFKADASLLDYIKGVQNGQ